MVAIWSAAACRRSNVAASRGYESGAKAPHSRFGDGVKQGWYLVGRSNRVRVSDRYPTTERWGFRWAWLGDETPFALPDVAAPYQRTLLQQRVRAHPDIVFANGFDLAHFAPSHGIEVTTASLEIESPWKIAHRIKGRLPNRPSLTWVGLSGASIDATFTQYGGGIVHVHITQPIEYFIVFTIRPDSNGHSRTQTILFLERRRDLVRALALLWATALDDIPLMESITWRGRLTANDAVLEQYVRYVENMPQWR
ncbi:MAG TPA: hypothetical protein VII32_15960 [Thermoanaerobaculia bacterium]|jgi:phenylpropionate dioxygenase-like ring-hydroxylating dioxygenase large terminal subunit